MRLRRTNSPKRLCINEHYSFLPLTNALYSLQRPLSNHMGWMSSTLSNCHYPITRGRCLSFSVTNTVRGRFDWCCPYTLIAFSVPTAPTLAAGHSPHPHPLFRCSAHAQFWAAGLLLHPGILIYLASTTSKRCEKFTAHHHPPQFQEKLKKKADL